MPFSVGDKLGPYEVLAIIGAGGMGEVYSARDLRLGRGVAIKICAEQFSERFDREARSIAALNHPNICHLYDVGPNYLVMELIDGEPLKGPLPLATALDYARQIADALESAHERGIIHRDLKPANIKITPEGAVKVLDFGLAKVLDAEPAPSSIGDSPTTLGNTRLGVILGTAAYMSPEQAVGRPVDRRSDIFSFGAVLYEMLTGQPAFAGSATPDVLEAVVRSDPDWAKLPTETTPAVQRLLRRCLVKDRKQRLQAIGEARIVLANPEQDSAALIPQTAPARVRFNWLWPAVALALAGLAAWGWMRPAPVARRPVTHFTMPVPLMPSSGVIALSRDGSRLAFPGGPGQPVYIRMMDEPAIRAIPGTEDARSAAFSPDGGWIAFSAGSNNGLAVKKIPVAGGAALTLVEGRPIAAPELTWGTDDKIYFSTLECLCRVPSAGGKVETLLQVAPGQLGYIVRQLLPGGTQLLATTLRLGGDFNSLPIVAVNVRTGEKKTVLENAGLAQYAPEGPRSGYLLYGRNGSVFAAPFELARMEAGPPVPVLEGVAHTGPLTAFGISASGTLAYVLGGTVAEKALLSDQTLVWTDRLGAERPLPAPARPYGPTLAVSPDGSHAALWIQDLGRLDNDLWVYDLNRGILTRLTFERSNRYPVWTPDGKRLIYQSAAAIALVASAELRSVPADGSGPPTTLTSDGTGYGPTSVSPDGKWVLGIRSKVVGTSGNEIWMLPLAGDTSRNAKPQTFLKSQAAISDAQFSPDGKWIAYQSSESGRDEIFVVPYPGPGGKWQVSTGGGVAPRWARNGRELFYQNGAKMMSVELQTGPAFRAETPKLLFEKAGPFDVSPDGKFLMLKPRTAQSGPSYEMHVLVNWFEELRSKVSSTGK